MAEEEKNGQKSDGPKKPAPKKAPEKMPTKSVHATRWPKRER